MMRRFQRRAPTWFGRPDAPDNWVHGRVVSLDEVQRRQVVVHDEAALGEELHEDQGQLDGLPSR